MESNDVYAQKIYDVVKGYRNDDGIQITQSSILDWASQFGTDSNFMLMEVAHLMPKIYYSKDRVIDYLRQVIDFYQKHYEYADWDSFLKELKLLRLQSDGKSQPVLLDLLDNLVFGKIQKHLSDYDAFPKKHYLYVDDILATGGTIGSHICKWLLENNHVEQLKKKVITLQIAVICEHTLGWSLQQYRIEKTVDTDITKYIEIGRCMEVQNNLRMNAPLLNAAIPIRDFVSKDVLVYYENLNADKNKHQAFRQQGTPVKENFFTSCDDRIKYEDILLNKGLEIINMTAMPSANVRPLGLLSPQHKMLGLGTHFITWRNIPNNCPLVFWWDVPEHNWKPLFKPYRHS